MSLYEGLRARVAEWSNPPILNLYINSFKLRLDHSGSQPFNTTTVSMPNSTLLRNFNDRCMLISVYRIQ